MRMKGVGYVVFAVTIVELGALSLFSGDFAYVWQPVPPDIPGRAFIAYVSGAFMCTAGIGLLNKRTVAPASLMLAAYTLLWLLLLHVPHLVAAPLQEVNWGACAEIALLVAASWILYVSAATSDGALYVAPLTGTKAMRIARWVFALALPLIGLEHLIYAQPTADLVPAWLPDRFGWATMTGIAHIAAGLAILFVVLPRLAAVLEAWMMGIFTLFVWIPAVIAAPTQRFAWTALLMSTVMTAAAWIVADSFRGVPWFSFSRSRNQLADLVVH
jgi:uncharacterized membrane protein